MGGEFKPDQAVKNIGATTPGTSSPAPGKAAPTAKLPNGPTGNAYLDQGTLGDQVGGLLGPPGSPQRARIVAEVQAEIDGAGSALRGAILSLRMDKLSEKEKEPDLPWIYRLILGAAGMYLSGILEASAKGLLSMDNTALQAMAQTPHGDLKKMLHEVALEGGKKVAEKLADEAKDYTSDRLKSTRTNDRSGKQKSDIAWLDGMADKAFVSYQHLRTALLANIADGDLLVALNGFKSEYHQPSIYKEQIDAKLDRFHKSGLPDNGDDNLGRTTDEDGKEIRTGIGEDAGQATHGAMISPSTRAVVQVQFYSGYPQRYAYQLTATSEMSAKQFGGGAPNGKTRAWLPMNHYVEKDIKEIDAYVPVEFEQEAIQRQQQVFGKAPELVFVDDSLWAWDPARASAALKNKQMIEQGAQNAVGKGIGGLMFKAGTPTVKSPPLTKVGGAK
jgi:hypothetical protein